MHNPTPQQRVEELVREFDKRFHLPLDNEYPGRRDRIKSFLRQALKQAYVAGLEDVEILVARPEGTMESAMTRDRTLLLISQLKEQINK